MVLDVLCRRHCPGRLGRGPLVGELSWWGYWRSRTSRPRTRRGAPAAKPPMRGVAAGGSAQRGTSGAATGGGGRSAPDPDQYATSKCLPDLDNFLTSK